MDLYSASRCETSNALVTLVQTKQDCLEKLFTRKSRYRYDDRAMRPICECPENCRPIAQKQPTIAQESPHYNLITILR